MSAHTQTHTCTHAIECSKVEGHGAYSPTRPGLQPKLTSLAVHGLMVLPAPASQVLELQSLYSTSDSLNILSIVDVWKFFYL